MEVFSCWTTTLKPSPLSTVANVLIKSLLFRHCYYVTIIDYWINHVSQVFRSALTCYRYNVILRFITHQSYDVIIT